jgi:hypothetical protein
MESKIPAAPTPLERAIALHLITSPTTTAIGDRMQNIVESARALLGNSLITLSNVKSVIEIWVTRQWVTAKNNYVLLTDLGKHEVTTIAYVAD